MKDRESFFGFKNAKIYVEIDEELVESINNMKVQDEGLIFFTSR